MYLAARREDQGGTRCRVHGLELGLEYRIGVGKISLGTPKDEYVLHSTKFVGKNKSLSDARPKV